MTALKLKKAFLVGLGNWLNDQPLTGRESRARTRFVAQLQTELNTIDKERVEALEKLAEKNEDGTVKKETGDNGEQYVLSPEAKEQAAKEYGEILGEDFIVDVTDANRENIDVLKKIVLETDYRFGPREGDTPQQAAMRVRQMNDYPEWCEAFEAI